MRKPVPFEIEHLDPRLRIYYESKSEQCPEYFRHFGDSDSYEYTKGFVQGYSIALGHIIEDLNNAAMGAAFDSIVDRLQ